jgi:ribosomal-protein-alanine N-acetyltransferase
MTLLSDGKLVGTVSLINVSLADARAELGYWVAAEYWRRGFCSEAAEALIQFAAESWGITRIVARCLARNPASAGVMEKVGMSYEGRLPLDTRKSGRFEDLLLYGLNLHGRSVA